jgi:hypothetical protein
MEKNKLSVYRFYLVLILISIFPYMIGASLNTFFVNMLSDQRIVIQSLRIPFGSVVIAPINEEIVKFLGYATIYIFGLRFLNSLGYKSKKKFRDDYLLIAFLISAGGFGFYEGLYKNIQFGLWCLCSFTVLNMLIHVTYSIYPYILGRKYNNCFFLFLPIGMLLHSIHNFIITNVLDDKWVTFTMVTFLLLPIVVLERKKFYKIIERIFFDKIKNSKKANLILSIIFILFLIYIFLCILLRFSRFS